MDGPRGVGIGRSAVYLPSRTREDIVPETVSRDVIATTSRRVKGLTPTDRARGLIQMSVIVNIVPL